MTTADCDDTDDRLKRRLLASATSLLCHEAAQLRDAGHGLHQSYSRKVFIPLTHLCRDSCHYCTFSRPPRRGQPVFMTPDEVLAVARAGAAAGCTEALFTLGDKPELRYAAAREALAGLGHATTLSYLAAMCALVLRETGLLPHVNAGVMDADDLAMLRRVSVSQGLMLETLSERLSQRGQPHFGSPDKHPAARLRTIEEAGRLAIPFTSGILIGIGETREERLDSLFALRDSHRRHGHIQEIIIQNFRAKPDTRMANAPEPTFDDLLWTIAAARIIFGGAMNIQAPPNLSPDVFGALIDAGINDWGGISPVTLDHVNPEAPWPAIATLERQTARHGKELVARLPVYPAYVRSLATWADPSLHTPLLRAADTAGFARGEDWAPGVVAQTRIAQAAHRSVDPRTAALVSAASDGEALAEDDIAYLFGARGAEFEHITRSADALRQAVNGDTITYVVNRNINYTNLCTFGCRFCAFSKGKLGESLRGPAYAIGADEVARRAEEAWDRGASEVCMQGGIHPSYTGQTYIDLCQAVHRAVPGMHIHAFSPLEVSQGAATLGLPVDAFLQRLKEAGLGTLPGTAAEILDDEVRAILCPDKLKTAAWLDVMRAAHGLGLRSTATIMFGHVDTPLHWARHLVRIRELQRETGGFTEFVPLPFVHMEAPLYLRGRARKGPTLRETVLMHAIARLVFHGLIDNIQVSWVKLGPDGARLVLGSGANDLGGTLMNESISRAAGTGHGQEFAPEAMDALVRSLGRLPKQRSTLYGDVPAGRQRVAYDAPPLAPLVLATAGSGRKDKRVGTRP